MGHRLARLRSEFTGDYGQHTHQVLDSVDETLFRSVFTVITPRLPEKANLLN
jgi:hypothetical protein